jgi:hypothetical protein
MGSERRHYRDYLADSARWDAIELRADDIVISTPAKCGTTWTQTIVAMLVLGTAELPAALTALSPWVDMQVRTTDELRAMLDAQDHRRFLKTHTPIDGLPREPPVTILTVFRHPLDVALSDLDHARNMGDRVHELRRNAVGDKDLDVIEQRPPRPDDPAEHLRQFIAGPLRHTGQGPYSLADIVHQLTVAWDRRVDPNVHLFHYADLFGDLDGEMRRIAAALGIDPDALRWTDLVEAATLDGMRAQASALAPEGGQGFWHDDRAFFRQGGRRNWAELLSAEEVAAFEDRVIERAGPDAGRWLLWGRRAARP